MAPVEQICEELQEVSLSTNITGKCTIAHVLTMVICNDARKNTTVHPHHCFQSLPTSAIQKRQYTKY